MRIAGKMLVVLAILALIVVPLAACEGTLGPAGPQGQTGAQGPQGEQGPSGPPGRAGGEQGAVGATGATGETGETGPAGPAGPRGLQGLMGPPGPVGPNLLLTGWLQVDGNTTLGNTPTVCTDTLTVNAAATFACSLDVSGSTTLGTGGTAIEKITIYAPTIDPGSVALNTSAEQTFAVAGLTAATDTVIVNIPYALTAGTGLVGVRVSSDGNLGLTFINATAGALDPGVSATWVVIAITR